MRKLTLVLMTVAVTAVIGALGLELVANALYFARSGKVYYLDARQKPQAGAYTAAEAVFHPYFSFIHRVGRSGGWWTTNNLGFQVLASLVTSDPGCCDIPLPKKDDEVVVGIFGGSVAGGFALAAQKSPAFAAELTRIPAWAGKKVRILNFGMPGFKQPQQLITLAYMLSLGQKFDLVVNLDGFNEIVTSHRNWTSGAEPSFPSDELWGAWGRQVERFGTPTTAGASARYLAAYYEATARDWRRRADNCAFASCYLTDRLVAGLLERRSKNLASNVRSVEQKQSLFPTAARSPAPADAEIHKQTAEQWAAASRSMSALARASGSLYLHVLHPNQWAKSIVGEYEPIKRDHIYKWVIKLIDQGYPELMGRIPGLAGSGVAVLDATAVFRGKAWREVYVDDCCHYTDAGNALLGTAIAAHVGTLLPAAPDRR